MAFSPFDIFRRNQKIFMSVIVIGVMFMFVLSFGRGDFFDWLPRWIGAKKSRGEVLAVIDGEKIRDSETTQIRTKRNLANQYMTTAAQQAKNNLANYAKENSGKVSPENRATVQGALSGLNMINSLMAMNSQERARLQQFLPQFLSNYEESRRKLENLIGNPNTNSDDLAAANAVRKLIALTDLTASMDRTYFQNLPNRNAKDSLEFMLWLKKADQLKIAFRTEDVDGLIEQEFLQQLKADEREKILIEMTKESRASGTTKDKILDAIADEFRVRMAQVAVMGMTGIRSPNGITAHSPFDFYEFYRTETSPAQYGVISVPVDNYLSRVEGQPTETELREIFNKAKNAEADPAEVRPGLKKGRELKIGWFEITGKEPFYATAAADGVAKAEIAAKISAFLAAPLGASLLGKLPGEIALATSIAFQKLDNPGLQGGYDEYRRTHTSAIDSRWYKANPDTLRFTNPILDTSYGNPQIAAATVGLAAMPLGTLAHRFDVANGTMLNAEKYEWRQRFLAGLASLPVPSLAGPTVLNRFTANAAATTHLTPAPLPLPAVKTKLAEEARDELRYTLARKDIQTLQDELGTINKGEDKEKNQKDAEAFLAKFAATGTTWNDKDGKPQLGRGLKLGASTGFFDMHNMGEDPGLAPLKARLTSQHTGTSAVTVFGPRFFFEMDPLTGQPRTATSLFAPFTYPEPPQRFQQSFLPDERQSQFLVWRTAEVPAEAAKDFDKSRAKCVDIWKRQKARDLAKKAADELAAKTVGLGNNVIEIGPKLLNKYSEFANAFPDAASKDRTKYFELNKISRTVIDQFGTQESNGPTSSAFTLKPTNDIVYPSQKMLEDMVANSTKPMSTSFVMVDRPENIYYVATVIGRLDRNASNFYSLVYNADVQSKNISGDISSRFEGEARKQAREEALELLKAEFKYEQESPNLDKLTGAGE